MLRAVYCIQTHRRDRSQFRPAVHPSAQLGCHVDVAETLRGCRASAGLRWGMPERNMIPYLHRMVRTAPHPTSAIAHEAAHPSARVDPRRTAAHGSQARGCIRHRLHGACACVLCHSPASRCCLVKGRPSWPISGPSPASVPPACFASSHPRSRAGCSTSHQASRNPPLAAFRSRTNSSWAYRPGLGHLPLPVPAALQLQLRTLVLVSVLVLGVLVSGVLVLVLVSVLVLGVLVLVSAAAATAAPARRGALTLMPRWLLMHRPAWRTRPPMRRAPARTEPAHSSETRQTPRPSPESTLRTPLWRGPF